ncbi:MAG TPA: DUF1697 domain-containing protein [Candidatus Sulfotelmatobacter sp.]|nr:DUF1697 domain-containing protein [Candidatus Sulfotelmatobacter sp.]
MPTYIALLRGINVGPNKRMKMEKLRASCEGLGFEEIKTYIQSGNIVFRAPRLSPAALSKKLEECISRDFGFSADVITRTSVEMEQIIKKNPLLKEIDVDPSKLHVVFLSEKPPAASLKKLQGLTLPPDRTRNLDREIYFYFPNGVSGSSLWKHSLDKVLSVSGTMRNWNTVNKLYEMARELE